MIKEEIEKLLSKPGPKAGRTQRNLLILLAEHKTADTFPTSPRFLFYELEHRGQAAKPDPDDPRKSKRRSIGWPPGEQDVGSQLTYLREKKIVPWEWITDETRNLDVWRYAPTVGKYLFDCLDEARINLWGNEEPPLILTEDRATAGVLQRIAARYLCPIARTSGQCGGFLHTDIAPLLEKGSRVLYLGDLDRSGNAIEANTRKVLENEIGFLDWKRIAMTKELAKEKKIEPIWKKDGRDGKYHWATEVEALGQGEVIALLEAALEELLPQSLASVQELEEEQRTRWTEILEEIFEKILK